MFSGLETRYLKTQRLARVASVSLKGQPEVSPVGFEWDGKYFYIGTHDPAFFRMTQRYKNITSGNTKVSLVIDDLASIDPWRPRGIKVNGTAEVLEHDGMFGKGSYIRITPRVTASWGIEPSKNGQFFSKKLH